jgi:shikimate dehydrogenase
MIKLAIIGYPLGHSLSPAMHNAALKELGIEGSYVVLETPSDKLEERVNFLKEEGFRGFNVTIPHKVEIMKFLDSIDNFASTVGAVNTVVIDENKKLHGYNTDVYGFVSAIPAEIRENLSGLRAEAEEGALPLCNAVYGEQPRKAAVMGSGGAARAILAGLIKTGIKEINIFAIDQEESLKLKEMILKNFPDFKISCLVLDENADLSDFSIVVNATPLGMQGKNEGISPLSQESIATLPEDAIVYDIVYKPQKTRLLEYAEKRGLKTIKGLEMLLLQGAKGFEIWTGETPPVEVMREALLKAI